ncbi:flavoprotein-like protein [Xylogone sp. PMI_703]|nr:flavoprotein-like protein [Xylogone sp. PMI_703]
MHTNSQISNQHAATIPTRPVIDGDLNNTTVLRDTVPIEVEQAYAFRSLAISEKEDDPEIREKYRPFILHPEIAATDWISRLELSAVTKLSEESIQRTGERLRILVLYGSLRERSYSKLLAFEASRILFRLGCDVRVFNPVSLPVKDDVQHTHPKVQELRELSKWSDGHLWVSPEQHGNLTAVFKNQIDWIPLSTGSVRPTQGRTLAVAQVSGGSQSFNAVNSLRILGRWMRMFVIPNQSSVPIAWKQFTAEDSADPVEGSSRMLPGGNRMRIVDCMEELVKYTIIMRPHFVLFGDRYSERTERAEKEEVAMKATMKATMGREVDGGVLNKIAATGK